MGQNNFTNNFAFPDDIVIKRVDMLDKDKAVYEYVRYMLVRAHQMVKLEGLPDTMPEQDIVRVLQTHGYMVVPDPEVFPELEGKLYGLWGGIGGRFDEYFFPKICTIANPYLPRQFSKQVDFYNDREGVLIRHDSYLMGLLPIFNRYATMLVEADISLYDSLILHRSPIAILSKTDKDKKAADEFIKNLVNGKLSTIYTTQDFVNADGNIQSMSLSGGTDIQQLCMARQYLKASAFNEIGLSGNYNQKKERLNSVESEMDSESLLPFADNILYCLQDGFDRFNKKYGYNVRVDLDSAWAEKIFDLTDSEGILKSRSDVDSESDEDSEGDTEVNPDETN